MTMKPDLSHAAREASERLPGKEILSFEYEGEKYWLKRSRPSGSNLFQYFAWRLSRFPLLVPSKRQSAEEALIHETSKIHTLRAQGISVPEIVLINREYFVMRHTGPTLRRLLYRQVSNEALTLRIFTALGELHRQGFYHGGSQLRNITYADGEIYFIDFEENFPDESDLDTLQLRDLFLLLFSIAKDRIPLDYSLHIQHYRIISGNRDFDRRLRAMSHSLRWAERILDYTPLQRIMDKDTQAVYRLLQELKKL